MYDDRPSTKRIVLTLVGLGVGLLAVLGLIIAISTALAPPTPPDTAPVQEMTVPAVATPSVAPTVVVPPAGTAVPPAPTPVATPSVAPGKRPLTSKVVVIDAGHQAQGDPSLEPIGPGSSKRKAKVETGTSGIGTRNPESLINLQVAMRLRQQLEARGAQVVMVRTSQDVNISNSKRAAIANDARADLFVRLHCDGARNGATSGVSTLVPRSNSWTRPIVAESKQAGGYVQKAVVASTNAKDRGVVDRGDLSGFNWAKVPTVLVEMGYLTNRNEDVKLEGAAYQQLLAVGLANGIEQYLVSN